jgi:hypothetical protein
MAVPIGMTKMKHTRIVTKRLGAHAVIASLLLLTALPDALAQYVLYGGLGGRGVSTGPRASTNDGSLVIVSQTDGSTAVVGHPAGVARISGLAFGLDGRLFGATQEPSGFPPPAGVTSDLIQVNPDTGALISAVTIREGGSVGLAISDLAVHPKTGALYGIRKFDDQAPIVPTDGKLYVIDTTTGNATLIGDTRLFFASIAFAPDGTLYMSAATYDEQAGPVAPFYWITLDPSNAKILTSVSPPVFFHSLTVRPDGVIFGGTADQQGVYTINPATGVGTLIGMTSEKDLVGDLAFRPEAKPVIQAVEYHHAEWDHYFVTASADEITKLDNGVFAGWLRTSETFNVYPLGTPVTANVCRFFSTSFAPRSSHFYTPFAGECATVKGNSDWQFEGLVFSVALPDAAGNCQAGTHPLYRLYNNGQGAAPNHRYTTSLSIQSMMKDQGWIPEGSGAIGVIACVPI